MFKTNKTLIKELIGTVTGLMERIESLSQETVTLRELNQEYHLVSLHRSERFTKEMEELRAKHEQELQALETKFKEFFGIQVLEKNKDTARLFQPGGILDHLFTSIKQLSYNKEKVKVVQQLIR